MNKLLPLTFLLLCIFVFVSCDDSSSEPAQFRLNNDGTGSFMYFTLGEYDGTYYYDGYAEWISAADGSVCGYTSIIAGTYAAIADTDSDHSYALVFPYSYTLEQGKSYTFTISYVAPDYFLAYSED